MVSSLLCIVHITGPVPPLQSSCTRNPPDSGVTCSGLHVKFGWCCFHTSFALLAQTWEVEVTDFPLLMVTTESIFHSPGLKWGLAGWEFPVGPHNKTTAEIAKRYGTVRISRDFSIRNLSQLG